MSMTAEKVLEMKKATTFELVDQRNSGFQLKGTEGTANPICLRSSKLNLVTMTSEVCLGKGKGYTKIMYFPNASVINIDDVWVDEKGLFHSKSEKQQATWVEQRGLISLYGQARVDQELRNAKEMKIGFEFGILSLDKYGSDPILLTYINNHHCNVDRPNAEHDTKQHSGLFKFRCVQMEAKAEKALEFLEEELEASEYVNSLRSKSAKGTNYTASNKAKIDATLRVLDLTPGCQPEEYSRKHLLIKQFADANPVLFMNFINDIFNQYKVEIGKGVAHKVIEFSRKENDVKILTEDKDKQVQKRSILTFESKDSEGQVEELTIHFINDSGIVDYKEVLMLMNLAASKN